MLATQIRFILLMLPLCVYSLAVLAQGGLNIIEKRQALIAYEEAVRTAEQAANYAVAYEYAQKIVAVYNRNYPDSTLVWVNAAYRFAQELKDAHKEVFALSQRSQFEFLTQQYDRSVSTALLAFALVDTISDDSLKALILYRLGEGYEFTARPQRGMEKYLECYELAETSGNTLMLARLDLKMGDLKQVNELYALAKKYYTKALNRLDKNTISHQELYYQALYDIYNVSLKNPNLSEEQMSAICDSVTIILQECRSLDLERYSIRFAILEKLCITQYGHIDKSLQLKSITALAIESGNKTDLYYQLFLNAKIAIQQKKYKAALEYAKQCEQIGIETQNIDIRSQGILLQKEIYLALGNYEVAYQETERYHLEKNKLAKAQRTESISKLEQQIAASQKETEILLLNKEKESLNTRLQLYSILSLAFGALLLLSLVFFQKSRRQNAIIATQNAALVEQKQQLETSNNTNENLFSIISHDLRNTALVFQSISKKVNYLIDKRDFDLLRELAVEMDMTAFEFNRLLQNLLTWTMLQKEEQIQLPMEMNIREASQEIVDTYQKLATIKNITFIPSIDDTLKASIDPQSFRIILLNLLDNAVKFCSEGDSVQLHISGQKNGDIILNVSDTGIGISKERRDTLFSFQHMESKRGTKGEKGVGFGLILVHELVTAHNGTIEVMSEEGQGSTFKVLLSAIPS